MKLVMEGVTKKFRDWTAVDSVSYSMENGIYGLLGVNGAGKTTLMRMITTLIKPTEGRIACDGRDIFQMGGEYRNIIGYLPQDFGYYPDFSVKDYLLYISSIKGIKPAAAKKRTEELIHKVGLDKSECRKMKKLSGGMKRRVGIAQAMLNDPKILILDEPTAGLDPNERIRFRNLISELSEDRLVLLSTHIVSDIEYIAGEILMMNEGRLAAAGTADKLVSEMEEKVWTVSCGRNEAEYYRQHYKVSNIRHLREGTVLRVLSDVPPTENAVQAEATLEDLFLYCFGERSGEEVD
ncbi:MAG: ABC transporter ATP-binding protein [Bacillota bacterium]|nr:ABC transporter ATP-binding protein [Bacillota bacterium]